jgi:HSP20 family molecular chaperone IbpA
MPEANMNRPFNPNDKNVKGFKISYHFTEGMDKPEIHFEGDIDKKELGKYLRNIDLSKHPQFKRMVRENKPNVIDAKELFLEPCNNEDEECIIEPFSEMNSNEETVEIIIEMPGIEKGHILISSVEDGKKVKITAENETKKFLKTFELPFKVKTADYSLDVNNGITTILFTKLESNDSTIKK